MPAGRVEEVERVARRRRVEHDHVEVALVVQLVQLRDRAELLRAGDGRGELAVDRGSRGSPRARPRRAPACATISSKVRLASSIIAHSSPFTRRLALRTAPASIRCGSPESSRSPSAAASRSAGSIVTTATFCPRAAEPERQRRRGRRLADAAGAEADADALARAGARAGRRACSRASRIVVGASRPCADRSCACRNRRSLCEYPPDGFPAIEHRSLPWKERPRSSRSPTRRAAWPRRRRR